MNKNIIFLRHNLIEIPSGRSTADVQLLGTIVSNLAYYGYTLSKDAYQNLSTLSDSALKTFWADIEPSLKDITGENRKMADVVVYKNFPKEVLDMSQAEYWTKQILMYWGFHKDNFTQEEQPRASMLEKLKLKVLHLSAKNSLSTILTSLLKLPSRWTKDQLAWALYIQKNEITSWEVSDISFKENMVLFIAGLIDAGLKVTIKSATDILRLAVGLSGGDVTMTTNTEFKSFNQAQRIYLLGLLENSTNLEEDVARDTERWKRFLFGLHVNEYKTKYARRKPKMDYPNVAKVAGRLYKDEIQSFNGRVEELIQNVDSEVLFVLSARPGEYVRRLNQLVKMFGGSAVDEFIRTVVPNLKVAQLLKIERYLSTINNRKFRTIAPQGNWTKLKVLPNNEKIPQNYIKFMTDAIHAALRKKVRGALKKGVNLSHSANMVKLQTNGAELATYGRGTVFPIPENINFIRTASYWKGRAGQTTWFDNGINFFDENWKSVDTLCWNSTDMGGAAAFSGDPVSGWNKDGRACQMIDIYLDKLAARGIRYGVWNILCFSNVKFNEMEEVFAAFQWGEDAQKGKLFEPSRAQFAFPITGDSLTKYVLYIDIQERKVVYMDANLRASVRSAASNCKTLETQMPAFVEYLENLPSVYDLFKTLRKSKTGIPVSYDDEKLKLKGEKAYVFRPVNKTNKFQALDINSILTV